MDTRARARTQAHSTHFIHTAIRMYISIDKSMARACNALNKEIELGLRTGDRSRVKQELLHPSQTLSRSNASDKTYFPKRSVSMGK
jgi:hypothetical protein